MKLSVPPAIRSLRPLLVLELSLWLIAAGAACLAVGDLHTAWAARRESMSFTSATSQAQEIEVPGADTASPHAGQVIGRLDISAIHLSVPLVDGDDTASLRKGAGRIPGTALPGGLGNMGIAAHRDTFFRPLRYVRPGMKVQVTDAAGTWTYTVTQTIVVDPARVDLLGIGDRPELTLVTCFPFNFIGAAPKRFLVSASLSSLDPGR